MIQSSLLFESVEEIYLRVFRELKPRTRPPEIAVTFRPYANIDSKIQLDDGHGRVTVRISDQLEGAPAPVQEALAQILLRKLYGKPIPERYNHRYRLYVNRTDVRRKSLLLQQIRGRKEIFDDLNRRFFNGLLGRPQLSWSARRSKRHLGHFDPAHNAIIISKIFDHDGIPRFLIEYVMYHEMLHLKYPVEHGRNRRRVHTKEFLKREREFPHYKEAIEFIKRF
jgi:hypothetical protein